VPQRFPFDKDADVRAIAVSPNERYLASVDSLNFLTVFDLHATLPTALLFRTAIPVISFHSYDGSYPVSMGVAFSPDGTKLAVTNRSDQFVMTPFPPVGSPAVARNRIAGDIVHNVGFADDQHLCTSNHASVVVTSSSGTNQLALCTRAAAWAADSGGQRLRVLPGDLSWPPVEADIARLGSPRELPRLHGGAVTAVCWSADGRLCALAERFEPGLTRVAVHDAGSWRCVRDELVRGDFCGCAFTADSRRLFVLGRPVMVLELDSRLTAYSTAVVPRMQTMFVPPAGGAMWALSWPDRRLLDLRVAGEVVTVTPAPFSPLPVLALSACGTHMACADRDSDRVVVFRRATPDDTVPWERVVSTTAHFPGLVAWFSPDASELAFITDYVLYIVALPHGLVRRTAVTGAVASVVFLPAGASRPPRGQLLVARHSPAPRVVLYDSQRNSLSVLQCASRYAGDERSLQTYIAPLAVHPSGRLLLAGGPRPGLWTLVAPRFVVTVMWALNRVGALSADGQRVVLPHDIVFGILGCIFPGAVNLRTMVA
jgi:hypothetical protein